MKSKLRLLTGMIIFAGAAVLLSSEPAYSTMVLDPLDDYDDARRTYCCMVDTDGDRKVDTYCCFSSGCSINSTGCRRVNVD